MEIVWEARKQPLPLSDKTEFTTQSLDITYTEQNGERAVAGRVSLLPQPFHGSILALKQFVDAIGATNASGAATAGTTV